MKRALIFEETVKVQHRIIVECEDESQIDETIECCEDANNLDDIKDTLNNTDLKIIHIDEGFSYDNDGIEFFDDYWIKDEPSEFGD